jgi:hypothetical protein
MFNPQQLATLQVVLGGVACLIAVGVCLPCLFQLLGLTMFVNWFEDNPNQCEPGGDDPVYADVCRQLRDLGFEPLGSCWERYWFITRHWTKTFHHRVFGSRARGCFVCVYRLFRGDPVRVAFTTCFTDQALIWTGNHMEEFRRLEDDYVRWGIDTGNLAELLAAHRQVVEEFVAAGRQIDAHDSFPVLTATLAVHNWRYVRSARQEGLAYLQYEAFWLGLGPLLVFLCYGVSGWWIPASVILGWVAKLLVEAWAFRQIALERHANNPSGQVRSVSE